MQKGGFTYLSKNADLFPNQTVATNTQYACALRLVKDQLEIYLKAKLTDELFIELFNLQLELPLPKVERGKYGYPVIRKHDAIQAVEKILVKHNFNPIKADHILSFFWFQSTGRIDLDYPSIILNIPHASTNLPKRYTHMHGRDDGAEQWENVSRPLVDYYTDELFLPQEQDENIDALVFDMCRVLCDVERLPNDPLEEKGLGIVLDVDKDELKNTYLNLDKSLYGELMDKYIDYQYQLSKLIVKRAGEMHYMRDVPLLLDCHSFSDHLTWLCNDSRANEIDICIGFNDDETRPSDFFISKVVRHFRERHYKVALNAPFSNSKTVPVPVKYHSLMIEVNKSLYMDEDTLEKTKGFVHLQKDIQDLYKKILH